MSCVRLYCYYVVQRPTNQEFPGECGNDLQFSLHRWKCCDMNLICKYLYSVVWCRGSVCVLSNICLTGWVINYTPDNMIDWGVRIMHPCLAGLWQGAVVTGRGVSMDCNRTRVIDGWGAWLSDWVSLSGDWGGSLIVLPALCPVSSVLRELR